MITNFKLDHKSSDNNQNNVFILISLMHINGFINDDSIKALFDLLRKGKLLRYVNTYYSNINKRWYNNEHIFDVYEDIFEEKMNPRDKKELLRLERLNKMREINGLEKKVCKRHLNFEEVTKYLNLYLNKNKNYCIDHLYHEFIKPNITKYEYNHTLNSIFCYDFSNIEKNHKSNDDYYCCEYCCGDYNSWYDSRNGINYRLVYEEIAKMVSSYLNTKREKYKNSYKEFVV